jgi:cohesin loading factor subunit SCC2
LAARQVHAKIHEKHESIIEGSYIDGIRFAAEYVKRITEKEIVEVSGDLGYLYDMIKSTRPSRRKLINNLLRSLEFDINLSLDGLVAHLNYVTFLSLSLAGVDFQSTEDVHFIVYGLDMFLSQTGTSLANKVEELLGSGEENVNVWAHVGIASTVVSVLLQLRQYCRAAYNLSDQKCRDFNPRSSNAKEFKTATKSEFATLDLKFDLPANLKVDIEASKNLAGLISQLVTSEPLSTTELHEPSEEPDSPKRKNIETVDQNPKLKQLKFE